MWAMYPLLDTIFIWTINISFIKKKKQKTKIIKVIMVNGRKSDDKYFIFSYNIYKLKIYTRFNTSICIQIRVRLET